MLHVGVFSPLITPSEGFRVKEEFRNVLFLVISLSLLLISCDLLACAQILFMFTCLHSILLTKTQCISSKTL